MGRGSSLCETHDCMKECFLNVSQSIPTFLKSGLLIFHLILFSIMFTNVQSQNWQQKDRDKVILPLILCRAPLDRGAAVHNLGEARNTMD